MSILSNLNCKFNTIPIKNSASYFCGYHQTDSEVNIKRQKTQYSIEGEGKSLRLIITKLKIYYKAIVIKTM